MTTHEHTTCTVRICDPVTHEYRECGKVGVYSEVSRSGDRTFVECAEHAAEHASMFRTQHMVKGVRAKYAVGDHVEISRHGHTYIGVVTRVGARGATYARVQYNNGAVREVRV